MLYAIGLDDAPRNTGICIGCADPKDVPNTFNVLDWDCVSLSRQKCNKLDPDTVLEMVDLVGHRAIKMWKKCVGDKQVVPLVGVESNFIGFATKGIEYLIGFSWALRFGLWKWAKKNLVEVPPRQHRPWFYRNVGTPLLGFPPKKGSGARPDDAQRKALVESIYIAAKGRLPHPIQRLGKKNAPMKETTKYEHLADAVTVCMWMLAKGGGKK